MAWFQWLSIQITGAGCLKRNETSSRLNEPDCACGAVSYFIFFLDRLPMHCGQVFRARVASVIPFNVWTLLTAGNFRLAAHTTVFFSAGTVRPDASARRHFGARTMCATSIFSMILLSSRTLVVVRAVYAGSSSGCLLCVLKKSCKESWAMRRTRFFLCYLVFEAVLREYTEPRGASR